MSRDLKMGPTSCYEPQAKKIKKRECSSRDQKDQKLYNLKEKNKKNKG
jgi:hypothetical protein